MRGSGLHVAWGDPKDAGKWKDKYCYCNYIDCPIAEMLYRTKYEEEKRP